MNLPIQELRDPQEARIFLLQGMWLSRAVAPAADSLGAALAWALEIAAAGDPLPPLGFLADLGHIVLAQDQVSPSKELASAPGLGVELARRYEDYVLGKAYGDPSFERGAGAVVAFQGRDRARAMAYLLKHVALRAGLGGAVLSPAVVKSVSEEPAETALAEGWESLRRDGVTPSLIASYERLVRRVRDLGELLGPEDLFELESGTALIEFGQRLALRQTLQAETQLASGLPEQRPRAAALREAPTNLLDEDTFPIGGYTSISTRGSIESLLHSQLAYMEETEDFDLFDVKFLRNELFYYSRDENQFFRRRRTFLIALDPSLAATRFKDPQAPWQRIILTLGLLLAARRTLINWLSEEALVFEFLFVRQKGAPPSHDPLTPERALLETLFEEQIANGQVVVEPMEAELLEQRRLRRAARSLCQTLSVSAAETATEFSDPAQGLLRVDDRRPVLHLGQQRCEPDERQDVLESWRETLAALLMNWA